MVGGAVQRGPAPRTGAGGVLLPCAAAIAVGTAVLALVTLLNLDDVSPAALTQNAFELGAAALFLAAGILRLARWRVTTDRYSGLLAAAMVVLGVLSLPVGNITGQLLQDPIEPSAALAARTLGTALVLALALRALTATDTEGGLDLRSAAVAGAATAVVGLVGLGGLVSVAPSRVTDGVRAQIAVEVALACIWLVLGLAASRRDALQPWAGRVAPLYGSLGVVELLRSLDLLQPGSWSLPAVALLGSVAMVTAHCAYVDLVEAVRLAGTMEWRTSELRNDLGTSLAGELDPRAGLVDFEVADVVTAAAERRGAVGQEVRVRGGAGLAHGRPGDLAATLDRLLDNAQVHAPHSPVTVHVVAIGARVEVSVTDRGPGLSAAAADRVFGTRLSLHVARALMVGNGGGLELRNRIGGATFVISLPAAASVGTPPTGPPLSPCAW